MSVCVCVCVCVWCYQAVAMDTQSGEAWLLIAHVQGTPQSRDQQPRRDVAASQQKAASLTRDRDDGGDEAWFRMFEDEDGPSQGQRDVDPAHERKVRARMIRQRARE